MVKAFPRHEYCKTISRIILWLHDVQLTSSQCHDIIPGYKPKVLSVRAPEINPESDEKVYSERTSKPGDYFYIPQTLTTSNTRGLPEAVTPDADYLLTGAEIIIGFKYAVFLAAETRAS